MFDLILATLVQATLVHPVQIPQLTNAFCDERKDVIELLEKYDEKLLGRGLMGSDYMLEIFLSKDKRTWTAFITRTNGISCIVALGTNWDLIPR